MAQSSLKRFFGATVVSSEAQPSKRLLASVPSPAKNVALSSNATDALEEGSMQGPSDSATAEAIERKKLAALERKAAAEVAKFSDLDVGIPTSWGMQLKATLAKPFWQQLKKSLQDQQSSGKNIFPPPSKVFSALHLTPLPGVRAVIVGQDP
jgi:hypothetical protein